MRVSRPRARRRAWRALSVRTCRGSGPGCTRADPARARAQFHDENAAARALQGLAGRFYAGRPILIEFSPVTDFREATCRQYEENTCTRGGYCNFMHLRPISKCAAPRAPPPAAPRARAPTHPTPAPSVAAADSECWDWSGERCCDVRPGSSGAPMRGQGGLRRAGPAHGAAA